MTVNDAIPPLLHEVPPIIRLDPSHPGTGVAVLVGAGVFVFVAVLVGAGVFVFVGVLVVVGVFVFVGVFVGVSVFVGVGVFVGVSVFVGVGVFVGVSVFVGVGVLVDVFVAVGVGVFVAVFVGVGVLVDVFVAVGVGVFVAVFVGVGVFVLVGVRVGVLVFVGVCVGVAVLVGVLVAVAVGGIGVAVAAPPFTHVTHTSSPVTSSRTQPGVHVCAAAICGCTIPTILVLRLSPTARMVDRMNLLMKCFDAMVSPCLNVSVQSNNPQHFFDLPAIASHIETYRKI